jgi:H/ACA ribonucleoprotein complex subunit 4
MQELRRTRAGPFLESSAKKVTLHDVAYWFGEYQEKKDQSYLCKFIEPMEVALMQIPKIIVRDSAVDALCHGANLTEPGVLQVDTGIVKGSTVAIFTLKGEAVSLAKALVSTQEIMELPHGVVAASSRVLMPRSTYPKVWKSGSANEQKPK